MSGLAPAALVVDDPGRDVGDPESDLRLDPTVRARLNRLRRPALVATVLLGAVVAMVAARSGTARGSLDPDSATPVGARALRVLLEEQGVTVTRVRGIDAAAAAASAGRTLLVTRPDLLLPGQVDALADTAADLVLVGPPPPVLDALAPSVQVVDAVDARPRDPACDLPAAARAGRAEVGGLVFAVDSAGAGRVDRCYADAGRPTLVRVTGGARSVTVLGAGSALTNDRLAHEGNAALALNLLGGTDQLVWYLPTPERTGPGGDQSLVSLLPRWVGLAALQLAVVVMLVVVWRGRRLGPVVVEPLPVVVRAAETTEGRARLYQRSGARDRAAAVLRASVVDRLRPLLGLGRGADPSAVTSAAAGRSGRASADVAALLYGAAPRDDAALVRLADDLDALERTVRRP